ncbi:MAG TPA: hypothetical protein PLO67_05375 [Saprospiraceae bacterium]|nr:hypothetical protein [Saprospiraceae bacterium]
MRKRHIYYLSALALFFSACKDQPEPIPAYVKLEPFTVNATGGAAAQKITDGWLYVNGEFLGAYTLPATVPILAEGQSEVWVFPGVKKNGIITTPDIYSMMVRHDQDYTLTPGQTTVVQPVTKYDDDTVYPWDLVRASFDGFGSVLLEDRDDNAGLNFRVTDSDAFGGTGKSVLLEVDTAHQAPLMEIATEEVTLPTAGAQQTWLELNYKNEIPFQLWLVGTKSSQPNELMQFVYQFNVSEDWNKTYFNLTEFVVAMQQDKYRLFFVVELPTDNAGKYTREKAAVRLDNMRLLHF